MHTTLTRRQFSALVGTSLTGSLLAAPALAGTPPPGANDLDRALAEVEGRLGGRLGVAVLDTGAGQAWSRRGDERFPMCSTFKLLACGAVLARVDAGKDDLARRIRFSDKDVVTHSPVTKGRTGGAGMALSEICAAAMTESDNTAANLILASLGGPAAVTAFARSIGDRATRLDRWETALNEAAPGDPRDTTTPAAMAADLRALALGDVLSPPSRDQLNRWLVANRTGDARIRAGVPKGWTVGDKTGSGNQGTANDVAVIWPPGREPVITAVYITESTASFENRNAGIADVARALAAALRA